MRLQTDLLSLCLLIFLSLMGCERPLEVYESANTADLSATNALHEPRLISPNDGRVFTTTSQILLRWGWVSVARLYSIEVATDTLFMRVVFFSGSRNNIRAHNTVGGNPIVLARERTQRPTV